jgi:hypothetical protein
MSFNFSPKVVTDGLVLYLDAANNKSFISGSTSWNDLTKNQNIGTLINGPTFNSGSIVFDGVDDYISIPPFNFGTADFTISYWLYKNSRNYRYVQDLGGSNTGNISLGPGNGGQISENAGINVYGGSKVLSVGTELGATWYPINEFFELTISRSGSVSKLYLNGLLIYTDTATGNYGGVSNSKISDYGGGSYPFDGKIANVKFYNKLLTQQEVLQNYNALKGRFGL